MGNYVLNSVEDVVLVTLNNVPNTAEALAQIFEAIGAEAINVDMICQTAPYKHKISLSFTIDQSDLGKTLTVMGSLKQTMGDLVTEINGANTKLTIFSELLKTESGVAARLFRRLKENGWQVKLITTSDVEISLLVSHDQAAGMMEVLGREFSE